ncbi:MAG: type II secretion system GspH family protein [Clostridia bacterium]|nr:type II secretion system GspH family protein [Clostridia bacterium]
MKKMNKSAFTLLEVMLAMAILLIASSMVMQGFMSTLSYSSNTAIYAKDGAKNAANANTKVAEKAGKIEGSAAGATKLSVGATGYDFNVSVNTWSYTSHGSSDIVSSYSEGASFTSNRYAVSYSLPADLACPDCKKNDKLARDANDAPTYRWYCKDCKVYIDG